MARSRFRLFYWLAIIGALSGYLLGELILGTGNGLYVAPVAAIVGLLLAWALHRTRPVGEPAPRAEARRDAAPTRPQGRQRSTKVRVTKSTQRGKRR
jgi:hypothetical protein